MEKTKQGETMLAVSESDDAESSVGATTEPRQKRCSSDSSGSACGSRKKPKKASRHTDCKDKSVCLLRNSSVSGSKRQPIEKDEQVAVKSTTGENIPRPNRRLTNFVFYDSGERPQPIEMLEICNMYIAGTVLPLDESPDEEKEKGIRCEHFGRLESWAISGFEEGSPVIWVSTEIADYECIEPRNGYKRIYKNFYEKACACIEVYKKLSKSCGGNPNMSLDELVDGVVSSMSRGRKFLSGLSIENFVISHGEFIHDQLIGLDETCKQNDHVFSELPVLAALRNKKRKSKGPLPGKAIASGRISKRSLRICDEEKKNETKRKVMSATITKLINRIWGEFYSNYLPEKSEGGRGFKVNEDEETGNEDEETGNEDEETGNQDEETGNQDEEMGNEDEEMGNEDEETGNEDEETGNEDEETGNKDEVIENDDDEEENTEEENMEEVSEVKEEKTLLLEKIKKPHSVFKPTKFCSSNEEITWDGQMEDKTFAGEILYKRAIVRGDVVAVGSSVLVETDDSDDVSPICFVEYMFENSDGRKMVHGRLMLRGFQTVLGSSANEREVFLTNDCIVFDLGDVKKTVIMEIRLIPWGYQHRKANANNDKIDRARAEERRSKGLPLEYYCRSLYWPERGAFFRLPTNTMGLGSGVCESCKMKETQKEKETFKVNKSKTTFTLKGTEYSVKDFVYLHPHYFEAGSKAMDTSKSRKNVGLKPFVVCHLLEIKLSKSFKLADPESTKLKVRRFFRPEDISAEKAYLSDIQEVYYSTQIVVVPVMAVEGKCEVRKKHELPALNATAEFQHIFFCQNQYDPDRRAIKKLPARLKLSSSGNMDTDEAASRKRTSEYKGGECDKSRLATLDVFAGCGGLSEGLQQAGVSLTKWAIEYEEPAGEAFHLNHPDALMFINDCNVILRAIMSACGDADDCVSTSEATDLAEKLDEKDIRNLPRPGQVDFISGGPPCQGFSGMNRFNQGKWSKMQCEMILAFLSFADYFRPRFFLLENVRNFVTFNKGQTFRLTLASLLEMGYQVRFGVLEAGAYGIPQSRRRAFIWAASPEETLPEWPEPMHVFTGPELKVNNYAAVRSTATGGPFRAITVRDAIGDLPSIGNGSCETTMEYPSEASSWYQRKFRGDMPILTDHISKKMNELNLTRCRKIPKRPGADWHEIKNGKVRLSSGRIAKLIPSWLTNTAKRHNQWKGVLGRLDWEGHFPTSITNPQPMGKVGMCFHPDQDRILSVRECARTQGFPDTYKFSGKIHHKHRQIGNAVPPPLAFALGRKLKEAVERKHSTQSD